MPEPSYDYIESGSLLGINYKEVSSYPVGFEHELDMFRACFHREECLSLQVWCAYPVARGCGNGLLFLQCRLFRTAFPSHENIRLYKLFFVDSGLMCAMMLDRIQSKVLSGDIFVNEGALAENYVAGELTKHGISLNYYDRKSKHELDFVFPEEGKISIIEVKSGKDYKQHASLNMAQQLFAEKINRRIVMSGNNLEVEDGVVYLPFYMSMFMM